MIRVNICKKFLIYRRTMIFSIVIALIVAVQSHKLATTLTKYTYEGGNLYSEVNIIDSPNLLYVDEQTIIIFSEGNNIIQYFDREGNFMYSLSLSSYTAVDIEYQQQMNEFYGYYYRSQSWFNIDSNNVITFSNDYSNQEINTSTNCFVNNTEEYCVEKDIFGRTLINGGNNKLYLETNSNHYKLSLLILIIGMPTALVLFIKQKSSFKVFNSK